VERLEVRGQRMSRVIGGRDHSQHPSSSLRIVNELVRGPSVVRLLVNRSLAFKVDVDLPRQTATQRKRPVETTADRNRSVCGLPSISGNGNMLHCIFYGSVWAQRGGLVCIQEGLWLYDFDWCRQISLDGSASDQAVAAFVRNDPYCPHRLIYPGAAGSSE
jgi:hypothetical protein